MGSNKFAIIEEGVKDISVVTIGPLTTSFTKAGAVQVIVPTAPGLGTNLANTGFEGVAYNAAIDQFYVVKEKSSRQVYQVANSGAATLMTTVTSAVTGTGVTDLSGVFFDNSPGGHLYVLSDEGNRIIDVGLDGTLYGTLAIPGTQPEGITFSPDGLNMYIIGETREFYHFQAPPVPEPSSFAPAGMAFVGLVGWARHKRRSRRVS